MKARPKTMLAAAWGASLLVSLFSDWIDPYFLNIIIFAGINIILAVSLNLINGYTGQFSLGHAGFMAAGAYASSMFSIHIGPRLLPLLGGENWLGASLLFFVALLLGGLMAAVVGLVVGIPSLRLRGDYLAIVTLGFGEIIRVVFQNMEAVGGARGLGGIPTYTNLFWTFGLAATTIYVVLAMVHSTYGRGFLAVHDDEIAAEAIGINTTKYKVTAFVVGAFFAGMAGGLFAHFLQFITPEGFNFMRSIEIVVMVILGGMGNTMGVIAAAILLTVLPEILREIAEFRMIIYSLLLIILMITRPQGLFQWKKETRL
jgi:branched-chain amino acid transport system permease protein